MRYGIGVDSGDTFTDAVLFDLRKDKVTTTTKVLTTHEDLSKGIFKAIDQITSQIDPSDVAQVAVSSTLATNAIVEGRGGYVGLFILGWKPDKAQEFPKSKRIYLNGKFNPRGKELQQLNESKVKAKVEQYKSGVEGFAIAGYFSVRNPRHENKVKEIIQKQTDKPTISSHELSPKLGLYERAVTAVLNVRVIPIITYFLDSAKSALERRGISAPLMVVKSDGSLARKGEIKRKPIETIFSGPAASAIGARWLSEKDSGVVIDIGGTTVDIATLENGLPNLSAEGARVGKWQTKVKSMDLRTAGLGGDSEIQIDKEGNIEIGPTTAKPLAFGDFTENEFEEMRIHDNPAFLKRRNLQASIEKRNSQLSGASGRLLQLVRKEPVNETQLLETAREQKLLRGPTYLRELESLGFLQRIALTPTDLLHILGEYVGGNTEAPRQGAEVLASTKEKNPVKFAQKVKDEFEREIALEVVKKYVLKESPSITFEDNPLWNFYRSNKTRDLDVNFTLNIPVIGIGAPAAAFLPQVAERLNTEFIQVENYSVGNAIGAITSRIVRRIKILIIESPETEEFFLFLPNRRVVLSLEDENEAMARAEKIAKQEAGRLAREAGGVDISFSVHANEFKYGRGGIEVVAIGNPANP